MQFSKWMFVFQLPILSVNTLYAQNESAVISQDNAVEKLDEWGTFYTYYNGETYGTKDMLNGVAVINPGMQIHPPHTHAEEEFLMVLEGSGVWHLNGKEFSARAGDILYAKPWDIHGITNSGDTSLRFVVWKWNNKGVDLPVQTTSLEKPQKVKVDD